MLKTLKLKKREKKKKWQKKEKRKKKKENSTELQKPNVEAEVYDNNKNLTEYTHIHRDP